MTIAFFGGRIRTMEPGPQPQVCLIDGDRIAATGDQALLGAYPQAERRDLRGRLLIPGLIDAHHHLSLAALHPRWADLTHAASPDDVYAALRDQAAREPHAPWIRAFNWRPSAGPDASGPRLTRHDLDALRLGRPILLAHWTLHQGLVDSLGLDAVGIGHATPDPPGGVILRDGKGAPTGRLLEAAWSRAHVLSIAGYDDARWPDLIARRCRDLLAEGVTAVHDAAVPPAVIALYRRMAQDGSLPISVLALPHPPDLLHNPDAALVHGLTPGDGDERFRLGPVKFFADSGTQPAVQGLQDGAPVELGMLMPGLAEGLRAVGERGWPVAIHALGNVGIDAALDALEAAPLAAPPRLEHCVVMAPHQAARLAALDARAVVQPAFVDVFATAAAAGFRFDDLELAPFARLADAGVTLAASSDAPCAGAHPLADAAFGVTRRGRNGLHLHPEQSLNYETWLRAATIGAAIAGGQEHERGSLRPGKRADFVLLQGDLDPEHPPTVAETWLAGVPVYRASGR